MFAFWNPVYNRFPMQWRITQVLHLIPLPVIIAAMLLAPAIAAAQDNRCLDDAQNWRNDLIRPAYDDYAREMQRINDRYRADETNAWADRDPYSRQSRLSTAGARYTSDQYQAWQNLMEDLAQGWRDFQYRMTFCWGSGGYPSYNYAYPSYHNGYPYGYPWNNNRYGNSYPYALPYMR